MPEPKPRQAEHNAGAFVSPAGLIPVPMSTLSDDWHDEPTEPEDSDRVPEPEPEPPDLVHRVVESLQRHRKT